MAQLPKPSPRHLSKSTGMEECDSLQSCELLCRPPITTSKRVYHSLILTLFLKLTSLCLVPRHLYQLLLCDSICSHHLTGFLG